MKFYSTNTATFTVFVPKTVRSFQSLGHEMPVSAFFVPKKLPNFILRNILILATQQHLQFFRLIPISGE